MRIAKKNICRRRWRQILTIFWPKLGEKVLLRIIATCLICLPYADAQIQADVLYGSTLFESYSLDTSTGEASPIGNSVGGIALAFDSNSQSFYGANAGPYLYVADYLTGNVEFIGELDRRIDGLAYDPNSNTLYGSAVNNSTRPSDLVTINTETGAISVIGSINYWQVRGLAFDSNSNTLYGSDQFFDLLITIDTNSGAGTTVGQFGFANMLGLAFDPTTNQLYGTDATTNQVISVNTSSGLGTAIGSFGIDSTIGGLAFQSDFVPPVDGVLGDANGDEILSNLDIAPFVLALTDLAAFQAMYPDVDPEVLLDMNGDNVFDNLDIVGFVAALTKK